MEMTLIRWIKQLFCRHKEPYYKITSVAVTCENLEVRCRQCDKLLENKGLEC